MGCCISKTPTTTAARPKHHRPSPASPRRPPPLYYAGPSPPQPHSRPIPSPLPFEEESVKEVLISEISPFPPPSPPTPTPTVPDSLPVLPARPQSSPPPQVQVQVRQPLTPRKRDDAQTDILISKLEQAADVVSEYSDLYTLSGSLSVSTTATTGTNATTLVERKDSEVTSKASRPPVARSSPGKPPRKRAQLVGVEERGARGVSPPARRVQQASPERGRRGVVAGQGRDPGGGVRRNAGPGRRDSGEISRRRSSSPAQGRAGEGVRGAVGKSPGKRTGNSGNRSSGSGMSNGSNSQFVSRERDPAEEDELSSASGARGVDEEEDGLGVVSREEDVSDDKVRGGNDNTNGSESLENPHVSLECFIFL